MFLDGEMEVGGVILKCLIMVPWLMIILAAPLLIVLLGGRTSSAAGPAL